MIENVLEYKLYSIEIQSKGKTISLQQHEMEGIWFD